MKISATQTGFALYKEADIIGQCDVTPTPKGADITALSVLPQWRRKGYGSYLLKEILRRFGGYDREASTSSPRPSLPPAPGSKSRASRQSLSATATRTSYSMSGPARRTS